MLLTIITVSYQNFSGLKTTIESLDICFGKSEFNDLVEHVIIDGGSCDGSESYLSEIKTSRLMETRYTSKPDRGIYDAMNRGVEAARGKFIVFLNSGDEISSSINLSDLFFSLRSSVEDPLEAGLAYSSIVRFKRRSIEVKSRVISECAPRMPAVHQSMFFKRELLLTHPFNINFLVCGDYDNFARIHRVGLTFRQLSPVFSVFYAGGVSSLRPFTLFRESMSVSTSYFKLDFLGVLKCRFRLALSLVIYQIFCRFYGVYRS